MALPAIPNGADAAAADALRPTNSWLVGQRGDTRKPAERDDQPAFCVHLTSTFALAVSSFQLPASTAAAYSWQPLNLAIQPLASRV